jgi:hypothetical protein
MYALILWGNASKGQHLFNDSQSEPAHFILKDVSESCNNGLKACEGRFENNADKHADFLSVNSILYNQ